jgi:hypothetical protein
MTSQTKMNVPIARTSITKAEKYGLGPGAFTNAHAANDCSISLPLFHGMTEAEQVIVIEKVCAR